VSAEQGRVKIRAAQAAWQASSQALYRVYRRGARISEEDDDTIRRLGGGALKCAYVHIRLACMTGQSLKTFESVESFGLAAHVLWMVRVCCGTTAS
jgi:hypothetical protein